METGPFYIKNNKKLFSVTEKELLNAIAKCKKHITYRLLHNTIFGVHTEENLGKDPIEYYLEFAFDSIAEGKWEWKEGRSLRQQMIRIAENRIGKEVDKYKRNPTVIKSMAGEDIDEQFYNNDFLPENPTLIQEAVFSKKIGLIEEAIQEDDDLGILWECIKDGMKRREIAIFMEKDVRQIDKLKEKLINKVKTNPHFQLA